MRLHLRKRQLENSNVCLLCEGEWGGCSALRCQLYSKYVTVYNLPDDLMSIGPRFPVQWHFVVATSHLLILNNFEHILMDALTTKIRPELLVKNINLTVTQLPRQTENNNERVSLSQRSCSFHQTLWDSFWCCHRSITAVTHQRQDSSQH